MFNLYFYPVYIILLVLGGSFVFYRFIYGPYKKSLLGNDFDDLLEILNMSINTQIEVFEKNVFDIRTGITNSNFENYYKEICNNIFSSLPKKFFKKLGVFITPETIMTLIARKVKDYLKSKVDESKR